MWRGYYPVLTTAGTEPIETLILDDVTRFEVRFLPAVGMMSDQDDVIDRAIAGKLDDLSQPGSITPPAAVEVVLDALDWAR